MMKIVYVVMQPLNERLILYLSFLCVCSVFDGVDGSITARKMMTSRFPNGCSISLVYFCFRGPEDYDGVDVSLTAFQLDGRR